MADDAEERSPLDVARQAMRDLRSSPTQLNLQRAFWWINRLYPDERAILKEEFHPEAEWRRQQREGQR